MDYRKCKSTNPFGKMEGNKPFQMFEPRRSNELVPLSKESHMQGPSDTAKYVAFVLREFAGKAEP